MKSIIYCSILLLLTLFVSCKEDVPTPKPRGYARLQLPSLDSLQLYNTDICDFTFEVPNYIQVERDSVFFNETPDHPCWLNLNYPELNATIYLSYKPLEKSNLNKLTEDYHKMKNKHVIKADYIDDVVLKNKEKELYGLLSNVGGNVASSYQFYITDSSKHFVRGSLYFKTTPNIDSLQPAIQFAKSDLLNMLESWHWKD